MKPIRKSGILMPITSLPSAYAIGDLGPAAYAFIDFLKESNQTLWQILPLNPTDGINSHSPYSSSSAFAGNRLLISPQRLVEQGFLKPAEIKKTKSPKHVDYPLAISQKDHFLSLAYSRAAQMREKPWQDFAKKQIWLPDYALFVVLKKVYSGVSFYQWPKPILKRQKKSLDAIRKQHAMVIDQIYFEQWVFLKQWIDLKAYANAQGILVIGDIPIYVTYDSADVWCNPQYFQLDTSYHLKFISGCPPDYFSKTGQRWGNPTYNWQNLKKDHYGWWCDRIRYNLCLFDYLRIDHFRGFSSFWQIPAHEKLAIFGQWVKGPGKAFFSKIQKELGNIPIIAEDLGEIAPDVIKLMKDFKFPGMRVLLFAFSGDRRHNPHVPANYPANCVAYTGTHDNNTVQGWYRFEAKDYEKAEVSGVIGVSRVVADAIHWQMIEALLASRATTVIIPMQDVLGLSTTARMNIPATQMSNWQWRLNSKDIKPQVVKKLTQLNRKHKRNE